MLTMRSTKSFGCLLWPRRQRPASVRLDERTRRRRRHAASGLHPAAVRLGSWISVRSERARGRDDVAGDRGAVRDPAIVGREEQLAGTLADLPRRKPEELALGVRRVVEEYVVAESSVGDSNVNCGIGEKTGTRHHKAPVTLGLNGDGRRWRGACQYSLMVGDRALTACEVERALLVAAVAATTDGAQGRAICDDIVACRAIAAWGWRGTSHRAGQKAIDIIDRRSAGSRICHGRCPFAPGLHPAHCGDARSGDHDVATGRGVGAGRDRTGAGRARQPPVDVRDR